MTSVPAFLKQIPTDARNFIPVSSLLYAGGINALNTTTGVLTTATWAVNPIIGTSGSPGSVSLGTKYASSINGPGAGKLRDMGKTYVSTGRVFRKVQLIVPNTQVTSTFGVEGAVNTTPTQDYLTGYIELGWEGAGFPAPVARTA
jgi:hypothetical protein